MIEGLADKMAVTIKRMNPEDTSSLAVLKFGLTIFLETASIVILSLLIGWMTGKLSETGVVLLATLALRSVSGGFHFKTFAVCTAVSTFTIAVIPHILVFNSLTMGLTLASLVLVVWFAPSYVENHTRVPSKYYPLLKIISLLMVGSNLYFHSYLLALTYSVQAVSLIDTKKER